MYAPYKANGIAKQLRTKLQMKFQSFESTMTIGKDVPLDANLSVADFEKLTHHDISHLAYATLDAFQEKHKGEAPKAWSVPDALEFLAMAKDLKTSWKEAKFDDIKADVKLLL